MPFAARWTGRFAAATVFESPTSSLDIHATALAVASVTGSAAGKIEGVDLVPLLTKKAAAAADRTQRARHG